MAHHIDKLTIHSLRRLHNLHLAHLGRINLLVGENNCGKTTVLEAIAMFCRPLDPLGLLAVARRRAIKSSRESLLEGVRWLFPQEAADLDDPYYEGEVRIEGQGAFPCLEISAHFNGFGADEEESTHSAYEDDEMGPAGTGSSVARGAEITLSARVSPGDRRLDYRFELLEDERFIRREPPAEPILPVSTVSPFAHRVEQLQVSQLSEAILTGSGISVLECVNLIDSEVEELKILSRQGIRPTLWVRHKTVGYAPLYTLGDGVRRIVTMALALIEARDGVLLIDEIETAIHKDALARVFQWLVAAAEHYNVQLFVTTHSLEAVDAILESLPSDPTQVVGYRLQRTDRATTARRYDGEMLQRLRHERGLDVR